MAIHRIRRPQTRQPDAGTRLDLNGPLLRGSAAAVFCGNDFRNLASGKPLSVGGSSTLTRSSNLGTMGVAFRKGSWVESESIPAIGTKTFVVFWYGIVSAITGNTGNPTDDPTFLLGSNGPQLSLVSRIGPLRPNSANWGFLYEWTGSNNSNNPSVIDFISAGEALVTGKPALLVVVRRQTGLEFWHDGKMVGFTAKSPRSLPATTLIGGSFVTDSYWTSASDMWLTGLVVADWSADDIRDFSANPWRIFESSTLPLPGLSVSSFSDSYADTANAIDVTTAIFFTASQSADILSAAESILGQAKLVSTIADSGSVNDSQTSNKSSSSSMSDAASATDLTNSLGAGSIAVVDSTTISDLSNGMQSSVVSLLDSSAVVDGQSSMSSLAGNTSDSLAVFDQTQSYANLLTSIQEIISVSDNNVVGASASISSVIDSVTVSEVSQSSASLVTNRSDSLTLTDSRQSTMSALASILESIGVTDQGYTAGSIYPVGSTDTIIVTDVVSSSAAKTAYRNDSVSAIESIASLLLQFGDVTTKASDIPKSRWIKFEGSGRTVVVEGSGRTVVMDGSGRVVIMEGSSRFLEF